MVTLIVVVALLIGLLILQIALTHATARIVGATNATWKRATAVVAILTAWSLLLIPISRAVDASDFEARFGLAIVFIGSLAVAMFFVLSIYYIAYRLRVKQVLVFFLFQIVLIGVSYGIALPLKWYALEAFGIASNSMATNIYGPRLEGVCPECGGAVVMTIDATPPDRPRQRIDTGDCTRCGKEWGEHEFNGKEYPQDRLIAAKWYEPERWDAVVFRYPKDPSINYVKRVVGMPGEVVVIGEDGYLIVDGRRIEPPAEFANLRYTTFPDGRYGNALDGEPFWGDPRRPMHLGPDEYFVLATTRIAHSTHAFGDR